MKAKSVPYISENPPYMLGTAWVSYTFFVGLFDKNSYTSPYYRFKLTEVELTPRVITVKS